MPKRKTDTKTTKTPKRQTTIYFPEDVLKRTKKWGIDVDRELSDIVVSAVVEYLDRANAPK